jgi:hypothetical protein
MWDDGQTGTMKAKVTFRNFANAPNNECALVNTLSLSRGFMIPKSKSRSTDIPWEIYDHYNTNAEKSCILLNGYYPIDNRKHEGRKRNVKTLLHKRTLCDKSYWNDLETTILLLQELLPPDVVGAISCFK